MTSEEPDFLFVFQFFQRRGVTEALSVYDLFNAVSGLNVPVGAEDEAQFMAEVSSWFCVETDPIRTSPCCCPVVKMSTSGLVASF